MEVPVILPAVPLADPPEIPTPRLELPHADLPSYVPLVYPYTAAPAINAPQQKQDAPPEKTAPPPKPPTLPLPPISLPLQQSAPTDDPAPQPIPPTVPPHPPTYSPELLTIPIPGTPLQLPVPKAEILSAAAATSVISVAATLSATAVFKRLVWALKPVLTACVKRLQRYRGKPVQSWARQRLAQRHRRSRRTESRAQR